MVVREKTAILKVLQDLGYGFKATTLTSAVLTKFGERNFSTLFPGSFILGNKNYDDIYAAFKGLYTHKKEISWNMDTNRDKSKAPITKTVASYKRYLTAEDTQIDGTDDEDDDAPRPATQTTTSTMSRWGQHYVSAPLPSDDEEGEDTEDDE